ncbi:MAG: hypothetical protein KA715_06560 [Xanthomonadaceae bacterium]|nr:hypothetical protein [Xanthomonadaceae bacterium]
MKKSIALALLSLSLSPSLGSAQDSVTFYIVPAPVMDWTNVGTISRTALTLIGNWFWTSVAKQESIRPLGHSILAVHCGGERSMSAFTASDAMTDESAEWVNEKHAGLSVLFLKFPSQFESYEKMMKLLSDRYKTGKALFLKYLVSSAQCKKVQEYVSEFAKSEAGKWYGLSLDPLKGEGAGCTSYVVSALIYAGIITPVQADQWALHRRIPQKYMGVPFNPGNEVHLKDLILTNAPFAHKNEPGRNLVAQDPTRVYGILKQQMDVLKYSQNKQYQGHKAKVVSFGKMQGLLIDTQSND